VLLNKMTDCAVGIDMTSNARPCTLAIGLYQAGNFKSTRETARQDVLLSKDPHILYHSLSKELNRMEEVHCYSYSWMSFPYLLISCSNHSIASGLSSARMRLESESPESFNRRTMRITFAGVSLVVKTILHTCESLT